MPSMPPRPPILAPGLSVPGVEIRFVEFWESRPAMSPRSLFVHTNGARNEGTVDSAWNWSHAKPGKNTLPHYQVDRTHDGVTRARKMLPTDRRGIGNGTVTASSDLWPTLTAGQRAEIAAHGHVGGWSIVIETADLGWPDAVRPDAPGGTVGFDEGQAEMVAQIIAFEALLHGFPIEFPDAYWGSGVASHTEPFGFPFTTTAPGKPCPGAAKKRDMRDLVMPRARAIVEHWRNPPPNPSPRPPVDPEEDDMPAIAAIYRPDANVTAAKGGPYEAKSFALLASGAIRHASGPDIGYASSVNAPTFTIDSIDHYNALDRQSKASEG